MCLVYSLLNNLVFIALSIFTYWIISLHETNHLSLLSLQLLTFSTPQAELPSSMVSSLLCLGYNTVSPGWMPLSSLLGSDIPCHVAFLYGHTPLSPLRIMLVPSPAPVPKQYGCYHKFRSFLIFSVIVVVFSE